uniref:SGNH hydrolase-type esterase domain-containing protein n=1 Tax=Zooxanthella nutricula TaxID=1333877 RepID=A0A7S2LGN9_9DINO|mmetsp:Transcript_61116/g.186547  ORF Transcript_61116/g.186547 Transcript_61116/m.186547 type:complete len:275 (+) Transcript_61116:88-912(+)
MPGRSAASWAFIAFFKASSPAIQSLLTHVMTHRPANWWRSFENKNGEGPDLRGRLCLFGDSDVHFWEGRYPTAEAVGVGVSGAEMPDIAFYAPRFVEKYAPQAVVWLGGANDFFASRAPTDIVEQFKAGVAAIPSTTRVIYMGTKPELVSVRFYAGYQELNTLMRDYAEETPNVVYVQNWEDLQPEGMYRWDGLHLSQDGYDLWNCKVNALLRPGLSLVDARRLALNMTTACLPKVVHAAEAASPATQAKALSPLALAEALRPVVATASGRLAR